MDSAPTSWYPAVVARHSIWLPGLFVLVGCGVVNPPGSDDSLSAAALADVAMATDLVTEQILSAETDAMDGEAHPGQPSGTVTKEVTFSRTRPCLAGGEVHVEGTIRKTHDFDNRVTEAESSG